MFCFPQLKVIIPVPYHDLADQSHAAAQELDLLLDYLVARAPKQKRAQGFVCKQFCRISFRYSPLSLPFFVQYG